MIVFILSIFLFLFLVVIPAMVLHSSENTEKSSEPKLSEIYYGEYPMEVLTKEKYIKVNYNTVVSMVNSGIELIYHDYYEIYYFYEDSYDIWSRKKIFCLTTLKDTKKINNFLKNRKIINNESKEGYEYILRKISKYRKEQEEEANKAFQNLQNNFSKPIKLNKPNTEYALPASQRNNYNKHSIEENPGDYDSFSRFIDSCYM